MDLLLPICGVWEKFDLFGSACRYDLPIIESIIPSNLELRNLPTEEHGRKEFDFLADRLCRVIFTIPICSTRVHSN